MTRSLLDSLPPSLATARPGGRRSKLRTTMKPVVKIDRERKFVCVTFHGAVTADQVLQQGPLVASDPDFSPSFAEIVDLTHAAVADVSLPLAAALLANMRVYERGVPHILVAPADLLFLLAHRFQQLGTQSARLLMVRTMDEAYKLAARPQRRLTDVA